MIRYFIKGEDRKVKKSRSFVDHCLIQSIDPSDDELNYLTEKFKLDLELLQDGLDSKEIPRIETEGSTIYIFLKYFNLKTNLLETVLMVFNKKYIMLLSKSKLDFFDKFVQFHSKRPDIDREKFLLRMLNLITDHLEIGVRKIFRKTRVKILRNEDIDKNDIKTFIAQEDTLNNIISTYSYTENVYQKIRKHFKFNEEESEELSDILVDIEEELNTSTNTLKSISNLRDLYSLSQTNQLNNSIKFLTVLTLFINIPAMIFSFYGMNLDLPFSQLKHSSLIVIGLTGFALLSLFYFFKKMKLL